MTTVNHQNNILAKIERCYALAKSSNPNEAAIAVRQAKALMDKHNISESDLLMLDVVREFGHFGTKSLPALWVMNLVNAVAEAFECKPLFIRGSNQSKSGFQMIGVGAAPSIAMYSFDVLMRQLKQARKHYLAHELKDVTRSKTKLADLFCYGWTTEVRQKCKAISPDHKIKEKIDAYVNTKLNVKNGRARKLRLTSGGNSALEKGRLAAKDISLHSPMNGQQTAAIGFSA